MNIEQYRDLTLLRLDNKKVVVIACDSCGGIGLKEKDVLKARNEVVGFFTASVVLGELLAYKVTPLTIVSNFCVEAEPTGKEIIQGIKKALKEAELETVTHLTGSTEENMPTIQTAIGLTAIGVIDLNNWVCPKTFPEDHLYLIGTPRVGDEVLDFDEVSILMVISKIYELPAVHEILPVGSKGIDYEVGELCKYNELDFQYSDQVKIPIYKSAGPATCALISGKKESVEPILQATNVQYSYLGKFISINNS